MRKMGESFFIKTLLWFLGCSLIIWLSSYFMAKESFSTVYLFNIPVPKHFPLVIGLIWGATLVFSFLTIIKGKTKKIIPKVCFLLLLLSILFVITMAGVILIGSIQNEIDYFESLEGFFVGIPASMDNFFGIAAVILNLGSIGIIANTTKKYVEAKTSKHVVPITAGVSILLVIVMIAAQSVSYHIIRFFGFPYPRNVFETVFAIGVILICFILVQKINIQKIKQNKNPSQTSL